MARLTDGVRKIVLENGLTALTKENHNSFAIAIFTFVKAGYFNESDNVAGISHLTEHMFLKGTRRRGVGDRDRTINFLRNPFRIESNWI